jgi:hypothetical protein
MVDGDLVVRDHMTQKEQAPHTKVTFHQLQWQVSIGKSINNFG